MSFCGVIWSTSGVEKRHPLADETFRAGEADPALIGEQLPHGPDTSAAEVIDIVGHPLSLAQFDEILHRGDKVLLDKNALFLTDLEAELLIDLMASHTSEVVALRDRRKAASACFGRSARLAGHPVATCDRCP